MEPKINHKLKGTGSTPSQILILDRPDGFDDLWLFLEHELGDGRRLELLEEVDGGGHVRVLQVKGLLKLDVDVDQPLLDLQPGDLEQNIITQIPIVIRVGKVGLNQTRRLSNAMVLGFKLLLSLGYRGTALVF